MKIIDAHVHFSRTPALVTHAQEESSVDYSGKGYRSECEATGTVASVCMGSGIIFGNPEQDAAVATPMLADLEEELPKGMFLCAGINPHSLDEGAIIRLKSLIEAKQIVGLKIYAGYYHFHVYDPVYTPAYRLAAEYGIPVAIHSGDTFSETALLEYAHPLKVDRLAVTWRDVHFIICHLGSPWIYDATEVAYKNRNVSLDLSGLFVGDSKEVSELTQRGYWMMHYHQAMDYLNDCDKLIFGSDWPLVPMEGYINYVKGMIPKEYWEQVFYENAVRVYRLPL